MAAVEYLIYDGSRLVEMKCMRGCGQTIGKLNPKTEKMVAWNNYRVWPLKLADKSYQNMLVCVDCLSLCSNDDLEKFDETRKWGWKKDLTVRGMKNEVAEKMVDDLRDSKKIIGKLEK